MLNKRYIFAKMTYPNYLILFRKNSELKYLYEAGEITKIFGEKIKVKKIKLDNLDIEKIEYENNKYNEYYAKTKLIILLKEIEKRKKNEEEKNSN